MTAKERIADFNPRAMKTFFLTFPFGTRIQIGVDILPMWDRWVEIEARSKEAAKVSAAARFGHNGWQLNGEDGFPESRKRFYPNGCCLVIINPQD